MKYKVTIYTIQISILILEATSNLLQPEYAVKIFNTETVILSLGDPDDAKNDDLEIIKVSPGKTSLEKKMSKFHKYVNLVEMTESPEERFFYKSYDKFKNYVPLLPISYPNFPYEIAINGNNLNKLTWRKKEKKRRKIKRFPRTRLPQLMDNPRTLKKRQVTALNGVEDDTVYDYLQKDYMDFVNQSMNDHSAFKYSDEGKPEENFKDVINKIIDIRTPKNCTEVTGIGLQAIECVIENYKSGQLDQKHLIFAISAIILAWFGIYLAVALPLWCIKGWCFCCFRCGFCLPNKTVQEIQKYLAQNPPGIYVNSEGEEERYNPTLHEIELYEQLKRSIAEF